MKKTAEQKKKCSFRLLLELFATYFKIGAFTFGGGYAMIPLIQREVVEKKKWITDDMLLEIIAIAESTPGPFAVNSATFVGYQLAGVAGSAMATLGVVLPSFVIILLISYVLRQFEQLKAVKYAFIGIRAGVLAMIVKALITLYKKCPKSALSYVIMAGALIAVAFCKVNALLTVLCCAVVGLVYSVVVTGRAKK